MVNWDKNKKYIKGFVLPDTIGIDTGVTGVDEIAIVDIDEVDINAVKNVDEIGNGLNNGVKAREDIVEAIM